MDTGLEGHNWEKMFGLLGDIVRFAGRYCSVKRDKLFGHMGWIVRYAAGDKEKRYLLSAKREKLFGSGAVRKGKDRSMRRKAASNGDPSGFVITKSR